VRHREVGERCRFAELRGSGLGVAYDRMAYVHDDLGDLQRAYGVLLDRFIRKQASTVDRMRRDLELSKSLLDKRLRALVPP
jgi:hypothetical protein